MTVLGVFLILVAVLVLVAVLLGAGGDQAEAVLDFAFYELSASTLGVFFMGAGTVVVLAVGLELLRVGMRRSRQRRQELKRAREMVAHHESHARPTAPDATRPVSAGDDTDGSGPDVPRRR